MTRNQDTYPVRWMDRQAIVTLPEQIDVTNAGQIREELLLVIKHGAAALIPIPEGTQGHASAAEVPPRSCASARSGWHSRSVTGTGRAVASSPGWRGSIAEPELSAVPAV